MSYVILQKLYYSNQQAYEAAYNERFHSEYAHHIDFHIAEFPAFFVTTPEIQKRMLSIRKVDKKVFALCRSLPPKAIEQFSLRCLIDEIVLTNNIEGVHSTRREINGVLTTLAQHDKRARFQGLVRKYLMLQEKELLPLNTCEDVRRIYDDLALAEVIADNPENMPDGKIFRKGPVSVQSPTQKELHRGLYPEEKIISGMEKALAYLNDENEELLYRTAVFHYLFGYIHPFYDGNGRLNRFISSYMLSNELEPVLGYRLSYTIKENLKKYYDAFNVCNHHLNRGDLTPFLLMFLEIIDNSIELLVEALETRCEKMQHYTSQIGCLPGVIGGKCAELYHYLIQAELFSEHGISTVELLGYLGVARDTLRKRLAIVEHAGLLKVAQIKNEKFYGINLRVFDQIVEEKRAKA